MSAARTIHILLILLGVLAAGNAAAAGQSTDASAGTIQPAQQEQATGPESAQPAAGAPAAGAPAAGAPAAGNPAASTRAGSKEPAAKRAPARRRSVQQVIGSMPPVATQTYGPTLTPPATGFRSPSSVAPAPATGPAPGTSPPPARLNTCVGNFCTDAAGSSYNRGIGNAAVNSQGRLCNRVGNTMQCF